MDTHLLLNSAWQIETDNRVPFFYLIFRCKLHNIVGAGFVAGIGYVPTSYTLGFCDPDYMIWPHVLVAFRRAHCF